jgi:prepilin-type processing-associated H-X9-DG protein
VKARDVYLCPSIIRVVAAADRNTTVRSYSMNLAIDGANILNIQASKNILFGDDLNIMNNAPPAPQSAYDGQFTTNEIAAWHRGNRGQVVYVDGHVEQR